MLLSHTFEMKNWFFWIPCYFAETIILESLVGVLSLSANRHNQMHIYKYRGNTEQWLVVTYLHIFEQILNTSTGLHLNAWFQNVICKTFVRKGYKYNYYLTYVVSRPSSVRFVLFLSQSCSWLFFGYRYMRNRILCQPISSSVTDIMFRF